MLIAESELRELEALRAQRTQWHLVAMLPQTVLVVAALSLITIRHALTGYVVCSVAVIASIAFRVWIHVRIVRLGKRYRAILGDVARDRTASELSR